MSKEGFTKWLEQNGDLGSTSIKRYTRVIDTLSAELEDYGLGKRNLYEITDPAIIVRILNSPKFREKNSKGNRMYSAALNHFKNYIDSYNNSEELQAELLKEETEFEKYLIKLPSNTNDIDIIDEAKNKPEYRTVSNRKVWKRNPKYASEAIAAANYLCEFNSHHQQFVSKFNNENYVEAHHLIPIEYQDRFDHSLDVHANIVSLCLVCHKKLHYGLFRDKKEIIDELFSSREDRLKAAGINIGLEELCSYYD